MRNSIYSLLSNESATAIGSTRAIACEWQTLNLQCSQGQKLTIVSANFGRTDAKMCGNFDSSYNTNCKSDKAALYLQNRCNDKNSCSAIANVDTFGDPCAWVSKYLGIYLI